MNWHDIVKDILFGFFFGAGFGLAAWILGGIAHKTNAPRRHEGEQGHVHAGTKERP